MSVSTEITRLQNLRNKLRAKVSHNDKHWVSTLDANTYEPGVYGWTEAT